MFIIKYKKIFLGFAVLLVVLSAAAVWAFGIRAGIDFTGGSLIEIEYAKGLRPDVVVVKGQLDKGGFKDAVVQPIGEKGFMIRLRSLDEKDHAAIVSVLGSDPINQPVEKQFNSIGPVVGSELRAKAWVSVLSVLFAIVLYIAFAFRKVSTPVSSSRYGLIAVIALAHDVVVPIGLLAVLGHFMNVEADVLFITALLTILGFSVHDTIVVFDRVRENLKLKISPDFGEVVGRSINQTMARSINTSLTVVLVLSALLVFGPASTYYFSFILLIGIISGTYSSIFIASPLLVVVEEYQKKHAKAVRSGSSDPAARQGKKKHK